MERLTSASWSGSVPSPAALSWLSVCGSLPPAPAASGQLAGRAGQRSWPSPWERHTQRAHSAQDSVRGHLWPGDTVGWGRLGQFPSAHHKKKKSHQFGRLLTCCGLQTKKTYNTEVEGPKRVNAMTYCWTWWLQLALVKLTMSCSFSEA